MDRGAVQGTAAPTPPAPRLAEGLELIGEYEGSGYKEPHYLARRSDGQVIQLTRLLYLVASELDGRSSLSAIADRVSSDFGRRVSDSNVAYLIERKLTPLGLVAGSDATSLKRADPLLALRARAAVIPAGVVRAVSVLFAPLYWPPIVGLVLLAFVGIDVWIFGIHGVAQGLRQTIYEPTTMLVLFGLLIVSAVFHEWGHAAACRYGGARPGAMGVGIYLAWPAFYTDVTDAYRLGRPARLRTDLGGLYFNAIFCLGTFAWYLVTGFEPLLLLIAVQHIEMIHQLLPLLRMDGYYVLADLVGVPDLFGRIGPMLKSLIPWRRTDERVKELKPWVRGAVTAWMAVVVPALGFVLITLVITTPRILATAWDSGSAQYSSVASALSAGNVSEAGLGALQLLFLALPIVGMSLAFSRLGRRAMGGAWTWSEGSAPRRAGVCLLAAGAAGMVAFTWWPGGGDYSPIGPDERWTVPDTVHAIEAAAGTGDAGAELADVSSSETGSDEEETSGADDVSRMAGPADVTQSQDDEDPAAAASPSPSPSTSEPTPTPSPTPTPTPTPSPTQTPAPSPTPTSSPSSSSASGNEP